MQSVGADQTGLSQIEGWIAIFAVDGGAYGVIRFEVAGFR